MASWTGIALARVAPGGDGMQSRLSTYLHPLAGRPLLWHTLSSLASIRPPADRLIVVGGPELRLDLFPEHADRLELFPAGAAEGAARLGKGPVLVVDGAAPALGANLATLIADSPGAFLPAPDGSVAAAWLEASDAAALLADGAELELARQLPNAHALDPVPEVVVVRDRAALARATRMIHDSVVARLMASGVTFLLPDSVLVDVDVQVGRDAVIYPGAVLEGQTAVGEETVVGPGCRIIDSWIGSGVELKGWNFISRSSVRNRAILEPYVRRGFD